MQPRALSARLCLLPQLRHRSHLTYGNSHVHTNSASYPRARMATSDAHARPRSSSTSISSSSSYSTSSTTGHAASSSVWFPSSYTAQPRELLRAQGRARPPPPDRARAWCPTFRTPRRLRLGYLFRLPSRFGAAYVSAPLPPATPRSSTWM
ncbi:hypothetical protein B0H14DRAFT_2821569, partial [Mycena olivaceomarginata]